MPYLTEARKRQLHKGHPVSTPGDLAYRITRYMIEATGDTEENPASFADHAQTIGAAVCAVLEYYRRATAPYEDVKRQQNGDVYPETSWPGRYAGNDGD
jgi:hypothetical protein